MFTVVVRTVFAVGSALLPLLALASASGSCSQEDQQVEVVDGIAYTVPDNSGTAAGKKDVVVELASIKLDRTKIAAAGDPEQAVREQIESAQAGQIRLTIGGRAVTALYVHRPSGDNSKRSGTTIGEIKLSHNDAKRVAGEFVLTGKTKDYLSCDVKFDVEF